MLRARATLQLKVLEDLILELAFLTGTALPFGGGHQAVVLPGLSLLVGIALVGLFGAPSLARGMAPLIGCILLVLHHCNLVVRLFVYLFA